MSLGVPGYKNMMLTHNTCHWAYCQGGLRGKKEKLNSAGDKALDIDVCPCTFLITLSTPRAQLEMVTG